ncbi:family 16 glycoside hydrolase [Prosthecobacter sp.]|uniref:family 16 glycoside hydrolase n=1 Tax=Prosthecobacter sp. TaxID=1965333 RepID=UPI001D33304A|nr:family 16 glycoside hydrolase [Prosthecobacter sp.]MCB1278765.1 DUF1080 domain-containing protein [Prosthecobacter sp.]
MIRHALKRIGGRAAWLCLFFVLAQCGPASQNIFPLNGLQFAKAWKQADIPESGKVVFTPAQHIDKGQIELFPGQPMTGAVFSEKRWKSSLMPVIRYSIEYEAMRVEGNDFFGTVTFPVDDSHVSLVVGGWGGSLVGISNIDDMDANENNTRGNGTFENNRWHQVRIEVRDNDIQAWIDGKLFVNVSTKGHKLGLRAGDIEKCAPFGFASYATHARIRKVVIRRL